MVRTRQEWRAWLARNHASSGTIWLVMYKKNSGKPHLPYNDAVEEGLCYGWVDSRTGAVDVERTRLLFSPRKPGSGWSKTNKDRVAKLLETGLMQPPGLATIERAKADGSWSALDAIEALEIPSDLQAALRKNKPAAKNFEAFNRSAKKIILMWIHTAKRPETRQKRIEETVRLAADNIKAAHPKT
jgi:uncharacterized protein YdeI (YjbR/CyaY-like superfamily)